eukprot:9830210-Prorocentrum_lima.AAC.1
MAASRSAGRSRMRPRSGSSTVSMWRSSADAAMAMTSDTLRSRSSTTQHSQRNPASPSSAAFVHS